jgi:hypothetical protein
MAQIAMKETLARSVRAELDCPQDFAINCSQSLVALTHATSLSPGDCITRSVLRGKTD